MRWQGGRESENVEDRRGMRGGPVMIGGGLGMLALVVIALLLGVDPMPLIQMQQQGQPMPGEEVGLDPENDPQAELVRFVKVVLADTEDVWNQQFRQMDKEYRKPTLILFNGRVQSACGLASAAVGPFYCPPDQHVYLDLSFFKQMEVELRAPGEFAQAYVIAHEVGHHVQNLLGIAEQVEALKRRARSEAEVNDLSVRMELQADFLAGLWAHHAQRTRQILEVGDIETALRAASAIGDDRLQRQATGHVRPDSFTHGTSEQRVRWFKRGLQSGRFSDGDTFNADEL